MVREARFARYDLEAPDLPEDRHVQIDDDDSLDEIVLPPQKSTKAKRKAGTNRGERSRPASEQRRHLAGADWTGTNPANNPDSEAELNGGPPSDS